jgi:hypothetical protein
VLDDSALYGLKREGWLTSFDLCYRKHTVLINRFKEDRAPTRKACNIFFSFTLNTIVIGGMFRLAILSCLRANLPASLSILRNCPEDIPTITTVYQAVS